MSSNHIGWNGEAVAAPVLTSSSSFRARTKKPNAAAAAAGVLSRAGSDADDIITFFHGSDPVRVELNRLENELRGSPLSLSLPCLSGSELYLLFFPVKFVCMHIKRLAEDKGCTLLELNNTRMVWKHLMELGSLAFFRFGYRIYF